VEEKASELDALGDWSDGALGNGVSL
jgi:hypothetical protein